MAETAARALPVSEVPPARAATFREVFADREFRAIWLAEFASVAGDQFARVALTVLVYQRTHSPLLTALTYAASYLPWVVGSLFLSDLADSFPRRDVMVGADLTRMLLVAVMALPGMPLWSLLLLLFAVTTLNAPFQGARSALRATILPGDRYALGLAVFQVTREIGVVGGFVAGGFIVTALHARNALLIDSATFAVSALLLLAAVRRRPAPERHRVSRMAEMAAGLRLVFATYRLRVLMLLGWLAAFYTVAEALAVPYAAQLRHGAIAAGLIFAAGPLGSAVGMVVFTRMVSPPRRMRWMGPMAVAACLLLLSLPQPPWPDPAPGHPGRLRPARRVPGCRERRVRHGGARRPARAGLCDRQRRDDARPGSRLRTGGGGGHGGQNRPRHRCRR